MTKEQKKHIAVLKGATENILTQKNIFCCDAIQSATGIDTSPQVALFKSVYESDVTERFTYGMGWWEGGEIEARAFALLFAAEMVRTDSLP